MTEENLWARELQLKVLVIVSCFPPSKGGVENSSYKLAMGMAENGHEVTVITSSRGKPPGKYVEQIGPLKVIRYPEKYYFFEAPLVPRIALAALTENYDILHVHGMTPPLTDLAIFFAKLRGRPVVLTYHNDAHLTSPSLFARLVEVLYSKAAIPVVALTDRVVSTTRSYAVTSPVLKYFLRKVTIIPWGTDAPQRRVRSPSLLKSVKEKKRLLFVGQMKEYKGVDILLQAVAHLSGNGLPILADIVGDGPILSQLKSKANKLMLDGNVKFWGQVDDQTLSEMFDSCDALVLPSLNRREAFGLVQLDAFAAGRTVVASDIPGVKDVAMMGRAYLARPSDVTSLADSISQALRFPTESKHLQAVAENLTWKKTFMYYEKILYESIKDFKIAIFSVLLISGFVALESVGSPSSQNISHMVTELTFH